MPITVERLPAERGASMAPVAAAGGCCCCCCCCLHTVGSLVGAATAKPLDPLEKLQEPPTAVIGTDKVEPKYDVWREYWISTVILCTVVFPLLFLRDIDADELTPGPLLLAFAMIFPAVQLAGSAVTFAITYSSKRPGREERLKHLGRITLRAFVGTLIGLGIMLPLLSLL